MKKAQNYADFLKRKVKLDAGCGFDCAPSEVNPILKPHQRDIVCWAVKGGRRAIFSAFGLGKTVIQLEALRLILAKSGGGRGLIVAPLGVRQEFKRDAAMLGYSVTFVRTMQEVEAHEGQADFVGGPEASTIYITNYESVRDGKLDVRSFKAVSLDEASVLRGFGGTKTFRELMAIMAGDDRRQSGAAAGGEIVYRFVATATPSPNEFIELLAYAAFLGVMDVGQAKTRFFKRDSTKADQLTLHPHKEKEFWLWVASWAIFLQKPSDLGYSDEGYELPPFEVHWHENPTDHRDAGHERDGQGKLFKNTALGVVDASREKRESLDARVAKMMEIVGGGVSDQWVIWCDLNDEQRAIDAALAGRDISFSSLYGSQTVELREQLLEDWRQERSLAFVSKPSMYGSGVNMQQAHQMVFVGIGFKFSEMIQGLHRIYRFLQKQPCHIHFIYTEAEREVRRSLEAKWKRHEELVANMTRIIREYGLSSAAMQAALTRKLGCQRVEESGQGWTVANNDCVDETARMKADSVGLILTSVPFATQYEYSPSYNDFGHTDDEGHFFQQMDFLTPELFRVLMPGRILAVHCKDRIKPSGLTGMGFQTVTPFSDMCVAHYIKHGFGFLSRKTIVTDVVRENAQTYRLGWTEQCKDGSRMGNGMPEYLLLFRKPPTDTSNGYADVPVVKGKDAYTRARWQFDAHGFQRSSGNRLLMPEDLKGLTSAQCFKAFREHSLASVYDLEHDVKLAEFLDALKMLPPSFMLLQPQSWHEDVWTDITRMRTLNGEQAAKGKEMHLCPLQFDIVDRAVTQYTNPGDEVYDPFGGLMTVPLRAVRLGRRGRAAELSPSYFADGVWHLRRSDSAAASPMLFDLDGAGAEALAEKSE